jgi:hypothetical protein
VKKFLALVVIFALGVLLYYIGSDKRDWDTEAW